MNTNYAKLLQCLEYNKLYNHLRFKFMNEHAKPLDLTPPGKAPKAPIPPGNGGQSAAPKEPKAPKAPKEPKPPKEPRVSRFAQLYPGTAKITVIVKENPKRGASRDRFEGYTGSATVAEALAKGVTYADLAWDVGHGLISVAV